MREFVPRFLMATCLMCLAGCGGGQKSDIPPRYPTTGVVNYKGQPVEGATVIFVGGGTKGSRSAAGRTDATGKFQLTTIDENDGCVEGNMQVVIIKSESPAEPDPTTGKIPPMKVLIPTKYGDASTSGLEAGVKKGAENHFEFNLD